MNRLQTDFLVPRMTFWTGAGSIFALFGGFYEYNRSQTEKEADARALYSDWSNVGAVIRTAMRKFQRGEDVRQLELDLKS